MDSISSNTASRNSPLRMDVAIGIVLAKMVRRHRDDTNASTGGQGLPQDEVIEHDEHRLKRRIVQIPVGCPGELPFRER